MSFCDSEMFSDLKRLSIEKHLQTIIKSGNDEKIIDMLENIQDKIAEIEARQKIMFQLFCHEEMDKYKNGKQQE